MKNSLIEYEVGTTQWRTEFKGRKGRKISLSFNDIDSAFLAFGGCGVKVLKCPYLPDRDTDGDRNYEIVMENLRSNYSL